MLVYLFLIITGLCIGSFLGVVISRAPKGHSVVHPRSYCIGCNNTLAWFDIIPVLSYVLLGGKCRRCKARIPVQNLVIEVSTAFVLVLLFYFYGPSLQLLKYFALSCILIAVSEIDRKHGIIPNKVLGWSLVLGVAIMLLQSTWHEAISAALAATVLMLGIRFLGSLLFRKPGMGMGDVKLVAVAGLYLGWHVFLGLYLAILIAGLVALLGLLTGKLQKGAHIAFAPFISLGMLPFILNVL